MAFAILFPVSIIAQVHTIKKIPESNNNKVVTVQPAVQTPANLIKVSIVCNQHNLSGKYIPVINFMPTRDYFSEVIIDNAVTNRNPSAFIIVTAERTDPLPLSVYYDQSIEKWKIKIGTNGQDSYRYGLAEPMIKGQNMVSVLTYDPKSLEVGDKFNLLINQ